MNYTVYVLFLSQIDYLFEILVEILKYAAKQIF
jgi:hypothetical protein